MIPPTGPTKTKIHFYLTFLVSITGLINANNPYMSIPMLRGNNAACMLTTGE